jgi:predicted deacetylase
MIPEMRLGSDGRRMRPQYLIRFDDICPTMNWSVWRQVEEVLSGTAIKPILAVVPDGNDESLKVSKSNDRFWDEVRGWQARGWTIGLHGYQHRYVTRDSGLVGINAASEFSGLPRSEQQSKLCSAVNIFEREQVIPEVWIAPSHSFDQRTLDILLSLGIRSLSDGFFLYPHLDWSGMLWIPQQLWRFRKMPFGLWTVCFHPNRWTQADVDRFRCDVEKFAPLVTDFRSVRAAYGARKRGMADILFASCYGIALKGWRWAGSRGSFGAHS